MRRFLKYLLISVLLLVLLLVGGGYWAVNNENFLKKQASKWTYHFTGRELQINGPLELSLGEITTVRARDATFGNPDWAEEPHMASVGSLEVSIDLNSLWAGRPEFPYLAVGDCRVWIGTGEEGDGNWVMGPVNASPEPDPEPKEPRKELPVIFHDMNLENCRLTLDLSRERQPSLTRIDSFGMRLINRERWEIDAAGAYDVYELNIDGWYEPFGALFLNKPSRHEFSASVGDVSLTSSGTVESMLELRGANVTMDLHGPDIGEVLDHFGAPVISEGPFDFTVDLDTEQAMTTVSVNGNFGDLDLGLEGELDRLLKPDRGNLQFHLDGSDLEEIGRVFGAEGLVAEPYAIRASAEFVDDLVRFAPSTITTTGDRVDFSGELVLNDTLANTDLTLSVESAELGRWATAVGQEPIAIGQLSLDGQVSSDATGLFSIDVGMTRGNDTFEAKGSMGRLNETPEPNLDVRFSSPSLRPLMHFAGQPEFPEFPVEFHGQLENEGREIQIRKFELEFGGQKATVDGKLNLQEKLAGSEFQVTLDMNDPDGFARYFGIDGLPDQPARLSAVVKPVGPGLAINVSKGELGDMAVSFDGLIADLENPLGIDADFGLQLPTLRLLNFLVPDTPLPDEPFAATGKLNNSKDQTHLEGVELTLGNLEANITGDIGHDGRLDILLDARSDDLSAWNETLDAALPEQAASLRTGFVGTAEAFVLSDLDASLGQSKVQGQLDVSLGGIKQVNGKLSSDYVDLSWLDDDLQETAEQEPADAPPPDYGRWMFGDEEVMQVTDLGAHLDLDLDIKELFLGNTTIYDFVLGLNLAESIMELDPIGMRGYLGSNLMARFQLDERSGTPTLDVGIDGEGIHLGLAKAEGQDLATVPPVDIHISVRGQGQTRREMASSLDGKIRMFGGSGQVTSAGFEFLLSDFLTELFSTLNPFAETSEYTEMDCTVVAADIDSGIVSVVPVIFNTQQITILSEGTVDLNTENIDLSFSSKPRQGLGLSAGALINPLIKVGGTLNSPAVELDPKGTVISGGAAFATAGLSILAKSMSDRFLSSKDPCGDARKELTTRDSGQTAPESNGDS